jgi:hypothetical protein
VAHPAHSGTWPLIQFRNHLYTVGRTPWTSDQPVARPLPTHRTTQTYNKRIHTPNIHGLNGIRTHDPSVRAREDRATTETGEIHYTLSRYVRKVINNKIKYNC